MATSIHSHATTKTLGARTASSPAGAIDAALTSEAAARASSDAATAVRLANLEAAVKALTPPVAPPPPPVNPPPPPPPVDPPPPPPVIIPGPVTDLQAALNVAVPGSIIDISGRTFTAPAQNDGFTIARPGITVLGKGTAKLISPSGCQALVKVKAVDVVIDGVGMSGKGNMQAYAAGIWTEGGRAANRLKVLNCTIDDFVYAGVMFMEVAGGLIKGNTIRRLSGHPDNKTSSGIALTQSSTLDADSTMDILVDGNVVEDIIVWHGIDTHGGKRITFQNNITRRCSRPIFITTAGIGAADIVIKNNRFETPSPTATFNIDGMFVLNCKNITCTGNFVSKDYGVVSDGVHNGDTYYNLLRDYGSGSTGVVSSGNTHD